MTSGNARDHRGTTEVDVHSDEIQLSAELCTRFAGHFRFAEQTAYVTAGPLLVDTLATNREQVLSGHSLSEFTTVPVGATWIPRVEDLPDEELDPKRIAVVLLAGGLSFRSGGIIHPLLTLEDPVGRDRHTLIRRQLNRLAGSPVAAAKVFIVGTLSNRDTIEREVFQPDRRPTVYAGGLAPRLAVRQHRTGAPILAGSDPGVPSYNPLGHFEALRWLILSGSMADVVDLDIAVIVVMSYSNWGHVFSPTTLRLARSAARRQEADPRFFLLGEVERCPRGKQAGSILVQRSDEIRTPRLVKYNYGSGNLNVAPGDTILMSTNTLYFGVRNVLHRLADAANRLSPEGLDLRTLFAEAKSGQRRRQLLAVFDEAFPVAPQLIATRTGAGTEFLRIERDLDQLTLLEGELPFAAVLVEGERAVFIKLPEDLADPAKRAYLFES